MASVAAAKPAGSPVKVKKPQPPLTNGNPKPSNPTSSPSTASKRLPGQKGPPSTASTVTNGVNGALSRVKRKEPQRNGETRVNRPAIRTGPSEIGRQMRKVSGPLVTKEEHILKKFKGYPPSLIIHLHPTYFRFDQQDGSFSYQSEMRFFIEHLQKRTIPHDILEEFKKSDVRFYDGWLIVRVIDHKSTVAKADSTSSTSTKDDETPFSINNYTPYITPSPWAPYPVKEQPKLAAEKQKSVPIKFETDGPNGQANDKGDSNKENQASSSEPKIYHVALRPTALSQHQDVIIDSMTPDPRSVNRKQSQVAPRAPGSSSAGAPPTPLSAIPPTPLLPPAKKQKMKVEPKDLLDYEARIVNATAPPLWLDPVNTVEEADQLLEFMRDPFHDEEPPSPKGRKRTVAELAADEAIAKEEERFMLIMDERLAAGTGAGGAGANAGDGQAGVPLFLPRFEKFNTLERIKQQHNEQKKLELEKKVQADAAKRAQADQEAEQKRREMQAQEARARQMRAQQQMAAQQMQRAQQQAVQQQQGMPQVNGTLSAIQHQQQILQASQAQRSSPIIKSAMSPPLNSSPIITNMSQAGHSVPMNVTSSAQGGSPPRPGSALQHGHPGVQMARQASQQARSQQGTPQMPQATPSMRQATPIMRSNTPSQRVNVSSPHGSMMGATPQMAQTGMMATPQMQAAQMSAQQAMIQQRQQQMIQQQQQMQAQGHQMTPAEMAHLQAQQHARQQQMLAQRQQMMQLQAAAQQGGQHQSGPNGNQFPNQQSYQAQVAQMMKQQMAHAQGQGSPQQHAQPMPGQGQQQRPGSGGQGGPNNSPVHQLFQRHRHSLLQQAASQFGGNPNMIPQQQLDQINHKAQASARRDMAMMMQQKQLQQTQLMQGMQQGQNAQQQQQQQMMMNPQMQAQLMAHMQAQQRNQQMQNQG